MILIYSVHKIKLITITLSHDSYKKPRSEINCKQILSHTTVVDVAAAEA